MNGESVIAVLGLIISVAAAFFAYDANRVANSANQHALNSFTNTVKTNFINSFPDGSKSCLKYIQDLNNSSIASGVQGLPHKVENTMQLTNLQRCLPHKSEGINVGDTLKIGLATDLKNKAKRALGALEHAAAEIPNGNKCALATELKGVMAWSEVKVSSERFRDYGVNKNPALFGAIKHYIAEYGGVNGLYKLCN
ncbi:hypothetical protein A9Q99_24865 [Gammaproteobacteria bacterium 45_16_T64]|nr:hypothetical protein A9Q99_24865 [Gammaproteobacteria bacterium 45_16_T64]